MSNASQQPTPSGAAPAVPPAAAAATAAPLKTPLFQAVNAARYQRQSLIRKIQGLSGRPLVCYVAGVAASVSRDDTLGFVDLLHNLHGPLDLDLLLQTPG